jgi:hypothetical protein
LHREFILFFIFLVCLAITRKTGAGVILPVALYQKRAANCKDCFFRSCFKTQFPLRTAAISSRYVVGTKFVLDVALATPVAILNLRLARETFARSRDESSFEAASRLPMFAI